jgi:hypothetical protein
MSDDLIKRDDAPERIWISKPSRSAVEPSNYNPSTWVDKKDWCFRYEYTRAGLVDPAAIREAALVDSFEKQVSDLRDTLLDQLLGNLDRADAIQQQLLGDIAEEQCAKFHRQIVDLHDAICNAMGYE